MAGKNDQAFQELGASGLKRFGGVLDEEFLRQLKGRRGRETYREMSENDAVIGAILFAVEMFIRQAHWRVVPADTSAKAQEIAEFIESCRDNMRHTWDDFISEVMSMLVYGFSYFEVVYKRREDGRIGWGKISLRSQDTIEEWVIGESGDIEGAIQMAPPTYQRVTIPMEKAILFRTSVHKNNPEGRSVLRRAYLPWFYGHKIEAFEAIGVERDLAGIPVAEIPAEMIAKAGAEYQLWQDLVVNIRRDDQVGIVIPSDVDPETKARLYDIKLMSSAGSRQLDTGSIIERWDRRKAMTVLADFILIGHEAVGSFALSDSKTKMFGLALAAWLEMITATMTRVEIPRLVELNGWPVELAPSLEAELRETPDLKTLGQYIKDLTGAGMPLFPDDEAENTLRAAARLPEKPVE